MRFGVSSACFYPQDTASALMRLQAMGIPNAEIFLNTFSELEPVYTSRLYSIANDKGTQLLALHPFSSGMETFFFASSYATRFADGLALYKKYFDICKTLGIKTMVFHGQLADSEFAFDEHCAHYLELRKYAREYGVNLCYENVMRCKCAIPANINRLREYCHEDVGFVLDVKQMRGSGVDVADMLSSMSGKIEHVHLSDCSKDSNCIAPGLGTFDIYLLFTKLIQQGFDGNIVIELYNNGFTKDIELYDALVHAQTLYNKAKGE